MVETVGMVEKEEMDKEVETEVTEGKAVTENLQMASCLDMEVKVEMVEEVVTVETEETVEMVEMLA